MDYKSNLCYLLFTNLLVIKTAIAIKVVETRCPEVLRIETIAYDTQDKLKNTHIKTTFMVSFRSCFNRFFKARLLVV